MQYQFGVPLAAQLRPHSVQARGPVHRRFEQVRREHELRVERVAEQAQGGSASGAAGVVDSLHSYVEVHGAENVPFEGDGLPVPVHGEQRMTIHIAMNNPQGSGQAGGLQAEAAGEIVLEFQNGIYGVDYEILIADMRTEGGVNHRLDVDTDSVASLVLTPHSGVRQFRVAVPLRVLPVMALGKQLRMMVLVQDLPEFPEQSFDIFRVVAAAADTPGMTFSESSLTVGEGGSASYTVALDTEPTASVTVEIASDDDGAATVSPTSLTFATDAWSTAQTVTVSGVQDVDTSAGSARLTHTASGGDYAGVTGVVAVTVTDDDAAGLTFSTASVEVTEGAATRVRRRYLRRA